MSKIIFELAEVFTGHTLRSKVENDPDGECSVIQVKDLSIADTVGLKQVPHRIAMQDIPENQILKKGDILLLSKGPNNKAMLYEGQYSPAVAVSAFAVIRVKHHSLTPEYLVWYINSSRSQEYFNAQRAGTTTLNLSKKAIDELIVPLPPLEKQESMMKLVKQYELYKKLVAEYEHNTRLLVEYTLHNHLNEQ